MRFACPLPSAPSRAASFACSAGETASPTLPWLRWGTPLTWLIPHYCLFHGLVVIVVFDADGDGVFAGGGVDR